MVDGTFRALFEIYLISDLGYLREDFESAVILEIIPNNAPTARHTCPQKITALPHVSPSKAQVTAWAVPAPINAAPAIVKSIIANKPVAKALTAELNRLTSSLRS